MEKTTQSTVHKITSGWGKHIVILAAVLFTIIEVLIAGGLIEVTNNPYLPANLQTQEEWWSNPIIWIIGITILVNFAGYVENTIINEQPYDYNKFVETFFKYLPMLILFSQFVPNEQSSALAFGLDYLSRALKKR